MKQQNTILDDKNSGTPSSVVSSISRPSPLLHRRASSSPDSVRKLTASLKKAKQERRRRLSRAMSSGEGISRPSIGAGRVSDVRGLPPLNVAEFKENMPPLPGESVDMDMVDNSKENRDGSPGEKLNEGGKDDETKTVEKEFLTSLFSGMTSPSVSEPKDKGGSRENENTKSADHESLLSPMESASDDSMQISEDGEQSPGRASLTEVSDLVLSPKSKDAKDMPPTPASSSKGSPGKAKVAEADMTTNSLDASGASIDSLFNDIEVTATDDNESTTDTKAEAEQKSNSKASDGKRSPEKTSVENSTFAESPESTSTLGSSLASPSKQNLFSEDSPEKANNKEVDTSSNTSQVLDASGTSIDSLFNDIDVTIVDDNESAVDTNAETKPVSAENTRNESRNQMNSPSIEGEPDEPVKSIMVSTELDESTGDFSLGSLFHEDAAAPSDKNSPPKKQNLLAELSSPPDDRAPGSAESPHLKSKEKNLSIMDESSILSSPLSPSRSEAISNGGDVEKETPNPRKRMSISPQMLQSPARNTRSKKKSKNQISSPSSPVHKVNSPGIAMNIDSPACNTRNRTKRKSVESPSPSRVAASPSPSRKRSNRKNTPTKSPVAADSPARNTRSSTNLDRLLQNEDDSTKDIPLSTILETTEATGDGSDFSMASVDPSHLDDSLLGHRKRRSTASSRRDTADTGMLQELMLDLKDDTDDSEMKESKGSREEDFDSSSENRRKTMGGSAIANILDSDDENDKTGDSNSRRSKSRRFTADTSDLASLLALRDQLLDEQKNETAGNEISHDSAESDRDSKSEEERNEEMVMIHSGHDHKVIENTSPSTEELLSQANFVTNASTSNSVSNYTNGNGISSPLTLSDEKITPGDADAETPSPTTKCIRERVPTPHVKPPNSTTENLDAGTPGELFMRADVAISPADDKSAISATKANQPSILNSCLKRKKTGKSAKKQPRTKKTIVFSSPEVAEYNRGSPSVNLTPMPSKTAKELYTIPAESFDGSDNSCDLSSLPDYSFSKVQIDAAEHTVEIEADMNALISSVAPEGGESPDVQIDSDKSDMSPQGTSMLDTSGSSLEYSSAISSDNLDQSLILEKSPPMFPQPAADECTVEIEADINALLSNISKGGASSNNGGSCNDGLSFSEQDSTSTPSAGPAQTPNDSQGLSSISEQSPSVDSRSDTTVASRRDLSCGKGPSAEVTTELETNIDQLLEEVNKEISSLSPSSHDDTSSPSESIPTSQRDKPVEEETTVELEGDITTLIAKASDPSLMSPIDESRIEEHTVDRSIDAFPSPAHSVEMADSKSLATVNSRPRDNDPDESFDCHSDSCQKLNFDPDTSPASPTAKQSSPSVTARNEIHRSILSSDMDCSEEHTIELEGNMQTLLAATDNNDPNKNFIESHQQPDGAKMTSNLVKATNRLSFGGGIQTSPDVKPFENHSTMGESVVQDAIQGSDDSTGTPKGGLHTTDPSYDMHTMESDQVESEKGEVTEQLEENLAELLAAKENESTVGDAYCISDMASTQSSQESALRKTRLIRRFSLLSPGRVSLSSDGNQIIEKSVDNSIDSPLHEEDTKIGAPALSAIADENEREDIPNDGDVDLSWKELVTAAGLVTEGNFLFNGGSDTLLDSCATSPVCRNSSIIGEINAFLNAVCGDVEDNVEANSADNDSNLKAVVEQHEQNMFMLQTALRSRKDADIDRAYSLRKQMKILGQAVQGHVVSEWTTWATQVAEALNLKIADISSYADSDESDVNSKMDLVDDTHEAIALARGKAARKARRRSISRRKTAVSSMEDELRDLEAQIEDAEAILRQKCKDETHLLSMSDNLENDNSTRSNLTLVKKDAESSRFKLNSIERLKNWVTLKADDSKISILFLSHSKETSLLVAFNMSEAGPVTCNVSNGSIHRYHKSSGRRKPRKYSSDISLFLQDKIEQICEEIKNHKLSSPSKMSGFLQTLELKLGRLETVAREVAQIQQRYKGATLKKKKDENGKEENFCLEVSFLSEGKSASKLTTTLEVSDSYPYTPLQICLNVEGRNINIDSLQRQLFKNVKPGFGYLSRTCDLIAAFSGST